LGKELVQMEQLYPYKQATIFKLKHSIRNV
jgi:hypothetical protein